MTYKVQHDLSRVDLNQLIETAQSSDLDDTPAMNEIIRRFERLTRRLVSRVQAADHHLRDDLANAARVGLVRAVRRHNGGLGFPAFAEIHMRGAVIREHKRWIVPETPDLAAVERLQRDRRVDDPSSDALDRLAPWGDGKVAAVIADLDPLQRVLVELRYIDDAPVKEIAEVMGTSGPAVSQRIGTIHRAVERALAA